MSTATTLKQEPKRTATKEARRQQLINATIDSISTRGFAATTLETVTKGAKLSHGTIHFHFENKEDLYVETLGYISKEHYDYWSVAMAKAGDDPVKQLTAILEVDFNRSISSPKKLAVWFAFWGQAKYRPAYLEIHNKFDDQRTMELERLCKEIVSQGQYSDEDPLVISRSLIAFVDGLWLKMLLYPSADARLEARNDCFAFLTKSFPKHFH